MNHTMIRVKDKDASIKFYEDIMGMTLKRTSENKNAEFNLYFLGYGPKPDEGSSANGVNPNADKEGLLELTWNYGTEKQEGKVYHDGNSDPQGFGHICVSVDDLEAACQRFEEKGVSWKKRLTDGRMKNVAFVLGECCDCDFFSRDLEHRIDWVGLNRSRWILDRSGKFSLLLDFCSRSVRPANSNLADPKREIQIGAWQILSSGHCSVVESSYMGSCFFMRCSRISLVKSCLSVLKVTTP
jgi:lactoylglutathione lyase